MSRIFVTGDKHGSYDQIRTQLEELHTTKKDVVIVLGDHGTLYYGAKDDKRKKKVVSNLPATFIMIRGNHDRRAASEEYAHMLIHFNTEEFEGSFYVDPEYPTILYTKEYGWYRFGSKRVFVINGAYSVDKYYRLEMKRLGFSQYHWFENEQLSDEERIDAIQEYTAGIDQNKPHILMTHTCPLKYKPWDKLMSGVDQSKVDKSTEQWLDVVEESNEYEKWYCGHWHIERNVDKIRFMYDDVELFDETKE